MIEAHESGDAARAWSYRPPSSVWLAGTGTLLIVAVLGAQLGADDAGKALRGLPWYGLAGLLLWAAVWRPRVLVADDAVTLVNPLRTVTVPWAAIITVETRFAFALRTPGGKHTAWAGPGPGRHQALSATGSDLRAVPASARDSRGAVNIGDLPVAPSGVIAAQVRRRWAALAESGALAIGEADTVPVRVEWHRGTLAAVGLLALLCVLSFTV